MPKILGLIPARGGSKGLPRKNIKDLAGKPLIAWTIEEALKSKFLNTVIVSTEDKEIANIALHYGAQVPFLRPTELAQDNSLRNDVINHALTELSGYDYLVLLQPTSPLRSNVHIDEAVKIFLDSDAESLVSVAVQHPSPEWIFQLNKAGKLNFENKSFGSSNRQSLPTYYKLNGAIYIIRVSNFLNSSKKDPFLTNETLAYEMPEACSIDIDNEFDLSIAEYLLSAKQASI